MKQRAVPGMVLIVIGLLLLFVNMFDTGGEMVVALIGAAFMVAFSFTHVRGFLVPGSIMTGLGIGIILEENTVMTEGSPVLLGLGAGFLAIFVINRLTGGAYKGDWWPLVPGGVLTFIGLSILADMIGLLATLSTWWPVVLIGLGVWILVRPREDSDPDGRG